MSEGTKALFRNAALEGMTSDLWKSLTPFARAQLRDNSGLTTQLIGLEGWRVEVIDLMGDEPRRFIVGKSTGWRPCHLEIKTRRSSGGDPAHKSYASVTRLEKAH